MQSKETNDVRILQSLKSLEDQGRSAEEKKTVGENMQSREISVRGCDVISTIYGCNSHLTQNSIGLALIHITYCPRCIFYISENLSPVLMPHWSCFMMTILCPFAVSPYPNLYFWSTDGACIRLPSQRGIVMINDDCPGSSCDRMNADRLTGGRKCVLEGQGTWSCDRRRYLWTDIQLLWTFLAIIILYGFEY